MTFAMFAQGEGRVQTRAAPRGNAPASAAKVEFPILSRGLDFYAKKKAKLLPHNFSYVRAAIPPKKPLSVVFVDT